MEQLDFQWTNFHEDFCMLQDPRFSSEVAEYSSLPVCYVVYVTKYRCFRRILAPLGLLTLKMKALGASETLVTIYKLHGITSLKACVFSFGLVIVRAFWYTFLNTKRVSKVVSVYMQHYAVSVYVYRRRSFKNAYPLCWVKVSGEHHAQIPVVPHTHWIDGCVGLNLLKPSGNFTYNQI
jgi:hypothetical protein